MNLHAGQPGSSDEVDRSRRGFLAELALVTILAAFSPRPRAVAAPAEAPGRARLFFTSQGKTGVVNADGSGLRYFDFDKPDQATWQIGATFPDGRRVLFLSMEP